MLARRFLATKTFPCGARGLASSLLSGQVTNDWTLNQLKQEAKRRGISQSGTKATVLARLQASDSMKSVTSLSEPTMSPIITNSQFQSTRTLHSSSSSKASPIDSDKFSPRRSAPLNIHIPVEEDEPEEGPKIPLLPDNYHSSEPTPALIPSHGPKVVTTASATTHPGGGPAFATSTINDILAADKPEPSSVPSPVTGFASSVSNWFGSASSSEGQDANLTGDERRGLVVLGGILFGGYILGGIAKKDGLPKEEHHEGQKL